MGLSIVAVSTDTSALAADVAAASATAQAAHDVAVKAEADAAAADAKAANARSMVISRDPRLSSLEDVAQRFAIEIARTDQVHADLQAGIDTALARAMTPGPAGADGAQGLRGPSGTDGVQGLPGATGKDGAKGDRGDVGPAGAQGTAGTAGTPGAAGSIGLTGPAGTANLALGMAPVPLLALGANTTVVVSLSRTMPTNTYTTQVAHSAVLNLATVKLEVVAKTTTTVSVKVTSVGVALAAGTLVVIGV